MSNTAPKSAGSAFERTNDDSKSQHIANKRAALGAAVAEVDSFPIAQARSSSAMIGASKIGGRGRPRSNDLDM